MSPLRALILVALVLGALGAVWRLRAAAPEPAPAPRDDAALPASPPPAPAAPQGRAPALASDAQGPVGAPGAGVDTRLVAENRRAIELLEASQHDAAIALFEACHAAAPAEPVFAGNLAEALARRALAAWDAGGAEERERALADLGRAAELAPERAALAERLARWRRTVAAEAGFWRDESEHFVLAYDGDRAEILHGAAVLVEELEGTYHELGELFGRFPVEAGRPKIRVVLYRRAAFGAVTGLGHWAGGAFDGTVRVPLEDLSAERSRLARVLRHELVHAFTREVGGGDVPGWLDEGLAQLLEEGSALERTGAVNRARAAIAGHAPFPLERLRGTLAAWTDEAEIRRAYAQSLVLVRELELRFGWPVLLALVEGLALGLEPAEVFRQRTGGEIADVLAELGG